MNPPNLRRRLAAEVLGTAPLLATIVGSGIMAERLSGGNVAIALLCNSLATGAMLVVLITIFGPVSGAHLNPAVTLVMAMRREITAPVAGSYILSQLIGAVIGTWLAHLMFGEPLFQLSTKARDTPALWLAEGVATFGLVLTIQVLLGLGRTWSFGGWALYSVCLLVHGLYQLRQPGVTIARSLTDTFAGIDPAGVPAFIVAQLIGAGIAVVFCAWMFDLSNKTE